MNKSPICFIASLSIPLMCMEPQQRMPSIEQLLNNRTEIVDVNRKAHKSLLISCKVSPFMDYDPQITVSQFITHCKKLINDYQQENPLFLINECAPKNKHYSECFLTRRDNPSLRSTFEDRVSTLLIDKITAHPNRQINYASFGCGGAFPELVIVTKSLLQKPTATLNIHLIDGKYQFSSFITQSGNNREVTIEEPQKTNSDITFSMNERKIAIFSTLLIDTQHKQFLSWLKKSFPQALISLFVYKSTQDYLDHTTDPADLITAIDINDEFSQIKSSYYHYGLLCLKTLQTNPSATNVTLDIDPSIMINQQSNQQESQILNDSDSSDEDVALQISLFNFSLEKTHNEQLSMEFFMNDNTLQTLYISTEKL